jgi:methenyltetrahydrofolate cyclohydrolase
MAELDLSGVLETLAAPDNTASAGSAAALVGAIAAAVVTKVARSAGAEGQAAQAESLSLRLTKLADADAEAFGSARRALAQADEGGDERRDFQLGRLLEEAAAVPADLAEACADVAMLAAELAEAVGDDLRPDAQSASWLAAGAARSAAHLVEVNLAVKPDDVHMRRARGAARSAAASSDAAL